MTEIHPTTPAVPAQAAPVDPAEAEAFEAMRRDAVLAGRAMSSGQYLAGLLAAAELETVGTPLKLPADMWPDVDPAVVQEIWDRACVVAWRAAQFAGASPSRANAERLRDLQDRYREVAYTAMGGLVGRSRGLVERAALAHPADRQAAREHEH